MTRYLLFKEKFEIDSKTPYEKIIGECLSQGWRNSTFEPIAIYESREDALKALSGYESSIRKISRYRSEV